MVEQVVFTLRARPRGFHLITDEVMAALPALPEAGLLHLFIRHTSAALTINENADPDVRVDLEAIFDRLVPERQPYFRHTLEGDDDMPAHAKASLVGSGVTVPIAGGRLALGRWQGIYLGEFRDRAQEREVVATIVR
ncbi:secondary thiamine-phosphate synthase enzyme YjbQ [uncultured Rikenella sp.]|uniref:secondary thiamine-phosphate synthase enzyme YjbQ n=1 Tax=uncultured Rikenella sp. TaxID=368003 RepID=UPI00262D5FB4|nr:secondary thiamine-phosphate synthase enzyme YjbQ [uncultured Rikenella sp.]